jgi:hypothetical protein
MKLEVKASNCCKQKWLKKDDSMRGHYMEIGVKRDLCPSMTNKLDISSKKQIPKSVFNLT